jgi:protein involved in polysaccharide export with SLBB domain
MVPTATPVSVFGMVEEPGAFDIDTSNVVTAAEMISRAGGFKEGADRDEVMLLRRDPAGTMTNRIVPLGRLMAGLGGDAGEVDPGDIIMVTPRDKVYVLGQVKSAGAFEIHPETPMTITRAIAMANGFDRLAAQNAVLLIRDGKVREINLARALKADGDTSIDEVIQPGDMIFVSESRW